MILLSDAKELSSTLHEEGSRLIDETRIEKLLSQFGKVSLGGSYMHNLLVDRDLDYDVTVSEMTPTMRAEIAKSFAAQPWTYGMNITDRINFEPLSNLQAPRGLYLGLTVPFPLERWNIDVWFTTYKIESEIDQKIKTATQEQKDQILLAKYQALKNDTKIKGITSYEIYKQILS